MVEVLRKETFGGRKDCEEGEVVFEWVCVEVQKEKWSA